MPSIRKLGSASLELVTLRTRDGSRHSVHLALGVLVGLTVLSTVIGVREHVAAQSRIAQLEAEAGALRVQLEVLVSEPRPSLPPIYFDHAGWNHDRLTPSGRRIRRDPDRLPDVQSLQFRQVPERSNPLLY